MKQCMARFGVNGNNGEEFMRKARESLEPWSMARVQQELLTLSETLIEPYDPSDLGTEPVQLTSFFSGGDSDSGESNTPSTG